MIAVTFALPAESSHFIKLLDRKSRGKGVMSGTLHGKPIYVLHTGVGERASRQRMTDFLSCHDPAFLVSSGFAGALTDRLEVGDVLLAQNYSSADELVRARSLLPDSSTHVGQLFTAGHVVDSAEARADAARDSGALAVDMETRFIAEACRERGIPMLSVRVISDTPAAPLPLPPEVMFDVQRQRTRYCALALHVATDPGAFWRLSGFRLQLDLARSALADAVEALITRS
ncbi:MAG TPA: hypothetical protein VK993_06070 [Chthoniobacterales bacterium]|nr:hypothetical protein [Chthoniobacterales bacterium]